MFALLLACAYDVEAWISDEVEVYCQCEHPETQKTCEDELMAEYESLGWWSACADDPAPVDRTEAKSWLRDWGDACQVPDDDPPTPEDPAWTDSCEG